MKDTVYIVWRECFYRTHVKLDHDTYAQFGRLLQKEDTTNPVYMISDLFAIMTKADNFTNSE